EYDFVKLLHLPFHFIERKDYTLSSCIKDPKASLKYKRMPRFPNTEKKGYTLSSCIRDPKASLKYKRMPRFPNTKDPLPADKESPIITHFFLQSDGFA